MKLVIFDIDGTLLTPLRPVECLQRFRYSIQKIFGADPGPITKELWKERRYNGMGDRYILWDMLRRIGGIAREDFLDRIGEFGAAYVDYLDSIRSGGQSYAAIPEAKMLLEKVVAARHTSEGILTGNLGPSASWKLKDAGYQEFAFGVYGHEADHRNDLAKLLLPKSASYFGKQFDPADIIIIGDTVNDTECARAIGAVSVIVHTGWDTDREDLEQSKPDLLVDTLMDGRVLSLLGLVA